MMVDGGLVDARETNETNKMDLDLLGGALFLFFGTFVGFGFWS